MDRFGWIVLADIPDPEGRACENPHPAMILRGPDVNGDVWLVGISTNFTAPPGRLMLECPCNDTTGLTRPCVLKCWWVVRFQWTRIIKQLGIMPSSIALQAVEFAITAAEEARQRRVAQQGRGKDAASQ